MKEIMKKVNQLEHHITMITFQDRLTKDDYARLHDLNKQVKELRKQIENMEGYYVELKPNYKTFTNRVSYLTDSPILCCGSEKTIFDSEEEAMEYLKKSDIYGDKDWSVTIVKNN